MSDSQNENLLMCLKNVFRMFGSWRNHARIVLHIFCVIAHLVHKQVSFSVTIWSQFGIKTYFFFLLFASFGSYYRCCVISVKYENTSKKIYIY